MPRLNKDESEIILRDLLKQPENRRCINCNTLGPQYVCTTFWTFVCTSCSGVHREFSHRVKSVSMAKFNEEEITSLQAGGNERAREIYFKAWDSQRNSLPDSSDLHRLREFIKYVYIDRRYAGANISNSNSLSMIHEPDSRDSYSEQSSRGVRNDFLRRLSFDRISSIGRDKEYATRRDREMDIKNIFEERSPRSIQGTPKSGSNRGRSNIRFEIVDDRFREDGSVKRYERSSSKGPTSGNSSPSPHRGTSGNSSPSPHRGTPTNLPAVSPVKELLGEKPLALKIGQSPKASDGEDADVSAGGLKTGDGALLVPCAVKQEQIKTVNSSSLLDFDATPSQNKSESQAELTTPNANNESSSVAPSTPQTAVDPSNKNYIEVLLLDWSDPVTSSDSTSQMPACAIAAQPNGSDATDSETTKAPEVSSSTRALTNTATENNDRLMRSNSQDPMAQMDQIYQVPLEQQKQQTFVSPARNASRNTPQGALSVQALHNQQLINSFTSNDQRTVKTVPLEQSSQAVCSKDEPTTIGRKELPQDLFTSHFNAFTPAVPGWRYGMQFQPPVMPVAAFPNPSRPGNPFDIGDERFQVQAANFPSLSLLQGATPNMPISTALVPHLSPYPTAFASHLSQYGMNMPQVPGAYTGQLSNNMTPTRPQGNAGFERSEDMFSSLNPTQQARGTYYFPGSPNTWVSKGGNPFG